MAVPLIIKTALSMLFVFKSFIFVVAISLTWSSVTDPTFSLSGCAAPFLMLAYLANNTDAGGDFRIKEIVDNTPKVLKEGATKEEAEEIKKDVEAAGGKIEMK